MESTSVRLKPLLTEKTTLVKDEARQVAFLVHTGANKMEIKKAVEQAFDVKVEAVNVVRRDTEHDFYFEISMTDVWVWDIYRASRFVKSVHVVTFKDVNVEELPPPVI